MAKKFHKMLSVVLAFVMVLSLCTPFVDVFAANEELTEVKQWNLVLGDEIAANFYVSVSDHVSSDAIMNVTDGYGTTSYNLNGTQKDENGNYIFTARMAAAQMGDTITLQLQDGATTGAIHTYKAVDYARVILKGNYTDNTKAMVKAMLNYGAAAQTYFDYNTENLVNVGYESTETVEIPAVETDKLVSGSASGISFYGASLVFESKVAVRFYFNVTGNIENYTFSTGELGMKNGMYYVEVAGINPQQYADTIALTVNDTMTVYYSPLQYISRMYTKTENADMKALLGAMYTYYLAAGAYEAGDEGGSEDNYTEIVVPGGSFGANQGITVNFESGAYDVVTFDYQITNGGTMNVCLMDSAWSKYYGYFDFGASGLSYEYDGVSYESLGNGYIRVTLDVAKLNRTNLQNNRDNAPETVGILYVRGDWSSAAGSIDNVRLLTKVSGGTEPDVPAEPTDVSISYEFTGNEANRAGYAEGVVTLSGGNSQENYELFWGNASGKLTGYKALATLTGANKTLAVGENVMIPAGADRLYVYANDQLVTSYMLEGKVYNAQAKTKFAVLSDVHTNYSSGETYLRTVLKKLQAEGVGYVIITGDIAEGNAEWAKYVSAVEDSGFTGLVLASAGNHDHAAEAKVQFRAHAIYDGATRTWVALSDAPAYFANTYAGSLGVAAEYSDMENKEAMYYLVTIDDNAYIFMNQELSNPNYTNHEDNFSRAQLNFVEDALYRYSKTHNVFIAQHAGIDEFVVNAGDGHSIQTYETFPYAKRFAELLKAYPEAIWLSGHSHYEFSEAVQFLDRLYVDGVLTDTAIARSFGCSSATVSSDFTSHSEGYVCYQYENDIVFEARRFKESGTDGNNENNFINLAMPANSFIIPVMVGNDHAEPILAENLVTAEGVTANGTYTVQAGNQSAAWNRDAYLRFYVQTELTNLTVGSVNVDLTAQSGSSYSIIHCLDGWKYVQVAFDALTTESGSADVTVMITGNGSFNLKEMYIEPIDLNWLRGENATQGQNINFDAEVPATDAVIFDYFALPGSELGIALLDDWSNFYGYFAFNENGAAANYAGITTEKLSDGYIRVTANLAQITRKVENPSKVTSLYIGGNRTTGAGMVDNVQFIASGVTPEAPEPIEYRGQEIVAGQDLSVMADQAANYSQVILDMIVPAEGGENEIGIALLDTNWNYYGYFYLEKTGLENPYAGVSAEKLSDGYWRITINIDEIDGSRTHGDVGDIERVYINNHTTGGYIDNVQFIMNDTPEESEPGSGRVLIAGDVHVSADDTHSQNQLRKTLTYAKNNGVDLLIFNGDTVNIGDEADYAALDSVFTDVFGSPEQVTMKFIFNMGNHEFYPTNACAHEETDYALQFARFAEFASKWSDFTAEQGSIYLTEVNGISYVVAAPSDKWTYMSDGKLVYCAAIGGYHENDIALIDSLIAQATAANPGEPVYLLSHHPWGETYGGDSYGMPEAKVVTGMRAVMEKYPHLVSVTSHTHFSSLHERSFAQDNWTTINTGMHTTGKYVDIEFDANGEALDYVNIEGRRYNNTDPEGKALHGTTHLVWDIRYGEDRFTATVFNLATETPYSHLSYTVPYGITADNKSEKFAYELTDRKASTLTWSAEDTLAATLVKNGSANTLNLVFSDTDQFYATEGYRIKVINSATGETLKTVLWASRFWAAQDMKDSYEITLDGLTNCDEYTITVEAIDFYGNYSAAKLEATVQSAGGSEAPSYSEIVIPGDSFAAGTDLTLYFEEGTYDVVTFDYKFTSGTKMWFGLLQADWSKFYGLFNANATGMNDTYTGISTENLSNGYIRVTLNLAELTRTNSANDANNAPETISMFFIRGDWSDAAGVIDNVRCLKLNEGSNEGDNEENDDLVKEFAGASFASGETKKISFDEGAYNTITLDYKLTSGTKLWFCIGNSGLTKYYGYFKLDANGVAETYDGVSYEKLSNGYIRVTLNLAELNRTNHEWNTNNAPEMVSCIYLRGGWNDSVGTIDNIRCLVAGSGNGGGAAEDVVRGEILTAGLDKQFNFDAKDYEALSFEYKIGSGEHFWMNLVSPDWAKYYGNYKFTATGEAEDYPGVTTEKLSDNYIRVTMLMVELTKTNNQPNLSNIPATFDKLYVRGDTNTAKGYIDNLQLFEKGSMTYDYTAGTDKTVHCREGMYDQISFNYTAESGKVLYIAVKNPSGDKYYGSFGFNANGEIQNYAGIATTVLADGAVNVVINLEELNRTGNADNLNLQPVTVNGLYILGNNTTSSGELSNVIFTETVDDTVYRGVPMLAGGDLTLDIGTGVYSQVSFEYIITNDSDFHVCFIGEDWSHFYGYFNFDADGAVLNYPGVFTEKLEDGYVRVTLDIDALTKTNNQENLDGKPSLLKKLYIRGDWSAANGYIDNIKTVAGEREIVRGKNLPNATNIDFHKFAAAYNSITLDYKISDGEMKVQLLDENGNASDIYRFNANGEVTDYAGITTSLRSDGYQKIIFKLSQLTNAPDKIATVRVLADSTGAGYVDNAQFLKTESATYARIGVISDVHLGDDHQGAVDVNRQSQRLERLLTNYKLMGVDGIVVSGDLVDHGTLAEKKAWMEVFAEVWLRVFPNFTNDLTGEPVEPIIIYGNHDTDLVNDTWWPESLGEYKPGYMTNVNGYYFVAAQYMEEYAATDYLMAAREDSNGNPFFYVQHCDFEGLLYNHTNVDHGTGLTAMDDLWHDANAITLNGHTHFTVTDERSIWQPSDAEDPRFTSISVPSINYGRVADGYTMNGNRNDVVQGLYIVLNGSEVSITRLSFHDEMDTDGEQIGAIWSFDAADPNDKPYGYETRANVTNKPVFAADAKITVTAQTSTSATISFPAATVTAPAGFSDMVQGYRVVVLDKTTGEVVSEQIITTAYHIDSNPNRMQSSYQTTLSGLAANTNYEIQVYAVEFYQVESDPLTLAIKLS